MALWPAFFMIHKNPKLITFNSETGTLKKYHWAQGSFWEGRLTLGHSGRKLALGSGEEIEIANLGETEFTPEGTCSVPGSVTAVSFGADDNVLAASGSAADVTAVTICRRTEGRWQSERTLPAASWRANVSPDPIELSPVAVSARGSVAYLGRGRSGEDPGRTVNVEASDGRRIVVELPTQVAALAFAQDETLLIGDRSGGVRAMSTLSSSPAVRILGQHAGRIIAIVASNDFRILSIGSDDIVRMWDLGFTEDMIGVSGVMEFPLVSFGISGLSYLGAVSVALDDDRLVTLNQSARGAFAHIWKVPTRANLVKEAKARLGP